MNNQDKVILIFMKNREGTHSKMNLTASSVMLEKSIRISLNLNLNMKINGKEGIS